jgi:uncharacterized membrane protein
VVTFGSAQHSIPLAALGAVIALVLVGATGALVHAPLSRVPENTMKFAVGVMLTTFGIFWDGEGTGADWPGSELALPFVLVRALVCALALVRVLQRRRAYVWTAAERTRTMPVEP